MNDQFDERIINALHHRADAVDTTADLEAVESAARRLRSRRRVVTGGLAAVVLTAAAGAGFGFGHAIGNDGNANTSDAISAPTTTDPPLTPATTTPTVAAPTTEPTMSTTPIATQVAATTVAAETGPADVAANTVLDSATTLGDSGWTVVSDVIRADGARVRLVVSAVRPMDGDWSGYYSDWAPAEFCWMAREARVELVTDEFIDVVSTGAYDDTFAEVEAIPFMFAAGTDAPRRGLLVQVDPAAGITEVSTTWPDGTVATDTVIGGFAVLLGSPAADLDMYRVISDVTVTRADGSTTEIAAADFDHQASREWRAACQGPPPALPEPGEQPADADAERAALEERFEQLWDRATTFAEKDQTLLDDWTGVVAAAEAVNGGTYADAAASSQHTFVEAVFTSPTEAWFRYSIETDITDFWDNFGTATLVDGAWQFSRNVVCQDFSQAMVQCLPGWQPIVSPAATTGVP